MLKRLAALSISVGLSLTGSAGAQEHNLPAMNAVGRFFGIGWSRGYQAGQYDRRFQTVEDRHPASMYGSNALLYPYHAGYEPQRNHTMSNPVYAQPVYGSGGKSQSPGLISPNATNKATPMPAPVLPPKPTEPPPTWLRQFLKVEVKDAAKLESGMTETREEIKAAEKVKVSPSDLLRPNSKPAEPTKPDKSQAVDDDDLLTLTPEQRFREARRKLDSNR